MLNLASCVLCARVFGWDSNGTIIFNDVVCTENTATDEGGCFYGSGVGIVNNGTVMHDNLADNGGCMFAPDGGNFTIVGGDFMCRTTRRGGFIYAGESGTSVKITGGVIANNVAVRRGGGIYFSGDETSTLTIEGGTFSNNSALELGGAIAARGSSAFVEITGGTFNNNTAKFYGGFLFLEGGASLTCEGVTVTDNYAGDQGGGIYAREATWLNSSCDLVGNQSPQGAALYLTNVVSATLENHTVSNNLAFSGSVLYMTASSVVANGVTFTSGVDLQEDSSNRAIQSDSNSELALNECVFDGWLGDTVIYHRGMTTDSVLLDSCDFRESSASMAVFSLNSDANIRNAVTGDLTFANAGALNNSLALVNRALDCSDPDVCGPGECVDSTLGVLCECLESGICLDGGGALSLGLKESQTNDSVTYSPDAVSFELVVSAAEDGTTYAIWDLAFEADDLELDVVPSSGILPPGSNVTVTVTGTPIGPDVGGDLTSSFNLTSVGSASSTSTAGISLEVNSTFYLCSAYAYAVPSSDGDGIDCEQCASIEGGEGVDCDSPGATLASLPIRQGYWRSSPESLEVLECLHSDACVGATEVSSANDYCDSGYQGPYCAVCTEGYGRGVSYICHSCDNTKGKLLIAVGALFSVISIMFLLLAAVFLVGGLDAVDIVRKSVTQPFTTAKKPPKTRGVGQTNLPEKPYPERRARNGGNTRPYVRSWENDQFSGEGYLGDNSKGSPSTNSGPDVAERAFGHRTGAVVGVGAGVDNSNGPGRPARDAGVPGSGHGGRARTSTVADAGVGGAIENRRVGLEGDDGGKTTQCCGLGEKVKRWAARLPLDKFKILVVIWQILAVFSSITGVEFPASYSTFLSWIDVVNFDIGNIFSASCVLPSMNFYARLLVTTLTPLVFAAGLVVTYQMAKRRAGIGSAGVIARGSAWSRHVAAGLLLTFLVFTSTSTVVFNTFACDAEVGDGGSYLRADYSLSCKSSLHIFFQAYAMIMIFVYPVGIPVLYAVILWKNRELLNPRIEAIAEPESGRTDDRNEESTDSARGAGILSSFLHPASKGQNKSEYSPQELQRLEERVKARAAHPELVPSMFLWKDFGPGLFYYEVIECGRRILLTGVLVFVAPHSSTQAATACIFAFGSLLGFELLRPHLDPADSWLYRMGCVVIFLSNFLALLIKMDAAGEDNRSALGGVLVAINVLLVLAVLVTSWFTVQQSVDDSREEDETLALAKAMLAAEQDLATSSRLIRERGARMPSVSSSLTRDVPLSDDPSETRRYLPPSRRVQISGASDATIWEDSAPSVAREESSFPSHRRGRTSFSVR